MTNVAAIATEKDYEAPNEQKVDLLRVQPEQVVPVKVKPTLPPAKLLALLHAVRRNTADVYKTPAILFMGPHKTAGAGTVAFETAYVSALSGKRVLFIDTNGGVLETIGLIRDKVPAPLNASFEGEIKGSAPFIKVQGTSLFFATFREYRDHQTFFPDGQSHRDIIDELRKVFDIIIAYSDTGLSNPLATILSGVADASIIVAEKERTRLPVIKDISRLIGMHGGHVAGVVLNKCQFHIPPFIYKALVGPPAADRSA